jgi:hypothetical protein
LTGKHEIPITRLTVNSGHFAPQAKRNYNWN